VYYANNVSAFNLDEPTLGHVDIPRLRKGRVGGFFWYVQIHLVHLVQFVRSCRSVYVKCPDNAGPDFVDPSWRVRYVALSRTDRGPEILNKRHPGTNRRFSPTHQAIFGGVSESLRPRAELTESTLQTFELTLTSQEIKGAIGRGKIASLLGVEG